MAAGVARRGRQAIGVRRDANELNDAGGHAGANAKEEP